MTHSFHIPVLGLAFFHRHTINASFDPGSLIDRYFEYLPENTPAKAVYAEMLVETDPGRKTELQDYLCTQKRPGSVEVNLMSKVDKINYEKGNIPQADHHTDALSALRGAANSSLRTSVVLSAGMNPRLYSYLGEFPEFKPDASEIPTRCRRKNSHDTNHRTGRDWHRDRAPVSDSIITNWTVLAGEVPFYWSPKQLP